MPYQRQEVRQRLAGASLRNADHVSTAHQGWNCLHLNWEGNLILSLLQNLYDPLGHPALEEGLDRPRTMFSSHFDIAVGAAKVVNLMILHVGDLPDLDVEVFAEGFVCDFGMVHHWQCFFGREALDEIKVRLLLLFCRLFAEVGVTFHEFVVTSSKLFFCEGRLFFCLFFLSLSPQAAFFLLRKAFLIQQCLQCLGLLCHFCTSFFRFLARLLRMSRTGRSLHNGSWGRARTRSSRWSGRSFALFFFLCLLLLLIAVVALFLYRR
mmetsp:Transcript_72352/g.157103  ORF Transcript_72352/g.157103 Transcript_72352/m.157103 type:complete len:265 (-) Transcript_72352:38-832(-)